MAPRPAKRLLGKHSVALLRRAQDAQRHHHLTFTFVAAPSSDLTRALRLLVRLGLVAHVRAATPRGGGPRVPRPITCTLRYWEGEPLVGVMSTPMRICSYHDLARRAKLGTGAALLLWVEGELVTARDCLERRRGGLLVATLTA
jgi:hypothetical protein